MKPHANPIIVVAAAGSGAGKTTVTLALMAAFHAQGIRVQGFKCGPDYIDPTYHTAVTGRVSRNLDTWMCGQDGMVRAFCRGAIDADISIVEGVMGLFDGKDPLSSAGSTAEIAMLLDAPVLLVIDVSGTARTAAATVLGCQRLEKALRVAGVIANRCGSEGHYRLVKAAIEQECGVPVVGWLGRDEIQPIPERQLGLVPAIERGELASFFEALAEQAKLRFDLDAIAEIASAGDPARASAAPSEPSESTVSVSISASEGPTIAVARDAAFHFYYKDNLEMLERHGANLVFYSPLAGEALPAEAHGLYIGGGFPEEFAAKLSGETARLAELREAVAEGLPVYAEGGGYMYISETIKDMAGKEHPMAGIVPVKFEMQSKLAALGYREAAAITDSLLLRTGETARGHEFRYSQISAFANEKEYAYETTGRRGAAKEGWARNNVLASCIQLHFASNSGMARRFVEHCTRYKLNMAKS